jgi:hypothetical protein
MSPGETHVDSPKPDRPDLRRNRVKLLFQKRSSVLKNSFGHFLSPAEGHKTQLLWRFGLGFHSGLCSDDGLTAPLSADLPA